jgi:hypothetical protein
VKWILSIVKIKDLTINLRHIMDFGEEDFEIQIFNAGDIVHNMLILQESMLKSVRYLSEERNQWNIVR